MPSFTSYGGGGGGFLPGSQNQYDPAYGGIPRVPNPTTTASSSIAGNLGNIFNLNQLATGAGRAGGAGVMAGLGAEIPGVSGSIGAATGNINELLSGQVPQDVITQLQQQAAELGAGSGMGPMSPSTNAGYLRALGLTSLGMKQQGQTALDSLMGSVPRAPAFDPSSMMVNPRDQQQAAEMAQILGNAPVPAAAARANVNALQQGVGTGQGSPVGGFNVPVRGGPAFANSPMLTPDNLGANPTFSGGAGYAPNDPYANWHNLASTWATGPAAARAGGSGNYYGGEDYHPEMGFESPEAYQQFMAEVNAGGSSDPYYDSSYMGDQGQ